MFLYNEIAVGASAYPATPQLSTLAAAGVSAGSLNKQQAWSPEFHAYRVVGGVSGGDVFYSYDGVKDAGRIPFGPDSVGGLVLPVVMPVYYQQVWLRAAVPSAATICGVGFYTKQ